jgi:hypothetical protein
VTPKAARSLAMIAITAAIVVIALAAVWLLEWVEVTKYTGFRGAAAINPLLACERMLEELGVRATSSPHLGPLPGTDAALILRDSGRFHGPETTQRLLDWSAAGGNLVLLFPGDARFLDAIEDDLEAERFRVPLAERFGFECVLDEVSAGLVEVDLGGQPLEVSLPGRFSIADTLGVADVVVGEPLRARLLSAPHGLGRVSLVADDTWATNAELGEHDHARLIVELVQLEGRRASTLIVFGERPPGLLALLADHAAMFLVAGACTTALYLWHAGARFGPLLPEHSTDRREFAEHIAASGEFLWRHKASRALLAGPREELRRRIAVARPAWGELELPALAAELSTLARIEPERARRALEPSQTDDPATFAALVRDLNTMKDSL